MGQVYTLCGPSGVGKTTFLLQLLNSEARSELRLLPRYTDRPIREGEVEGLEYYFTSHEGFLQKVFANDFIHVEKWGDFYSGIESWVLEEVIDSDYDGVVLASTFGAARLRATYGAHITPLYMWTGARAALLNPRCMAQDSPEVLELKWRIRKKLVEDGFSEFETASLSDDAFLNKRMVDNFLDIAAVNGRLRSGEDIAVLANPRDCINDAIEDFAQLRSKRIPHSVRRGPKAGGGCFVLMPFREDLQPVYQDHIRGVCESLGLRVTRADQIFSVRPIMDDIQEAVHSSRFIIADLTDLNPNVFYEVGICHALGKTVILVTQEAKVPFDLSHIRHIRYQYTPRGMEQFEKALSATLQALLVSELL